MESRQLPRLAAFLALATALIAVLVVLTSAGSTYVLHAQFTDAGQLVRGDLVTVAGHKVGSIGAVTLSKNALADVELDISDQGITPLRRDSRAAIGQLSLTGVANRFVSLTPGGGEPIPSGGTLPFTQTRGIVDLDTFLDAFTPKVRASLQRLLSAGAYLVSHPTDSQMNEAARYVNPAFSQASQLGAEVVADKLALGRLVSATAEVSTALAARSGDLGGAVANTAATFREIASERAALEDTISRAPAVLRQSTAVLGDVDRALVVLDPTLVDLQPVAGRLARLLALIVPAGREAIPTIAGIQALVPSSKRALLALPGVVRVATPAVTSLTRALRQSAPLLSGLRPYAPDSVAGFFNGNGGASGGTYDANGHYLKGLLTFQGNGGSSLTGLLNLLGKLSSSAGPYNGERSGLLAPCPGGGNPAAPDRSNPWNSPDTLPQVGKVCNPGDSQR